ncbi:unnamed protein product [Symbiodinium microadriaticum]|nr:unnamed protein product [Symbiodinium microadriaticum]
MKGEVPTGRETSESSTGSRCSFADTTSCTPDGGDRPPPPPPPPNRSHTQKQPARQTHSQQEQQHATRAPPQKRGGREEQQITLDMLKEVLAAERTKDRQHLAQSLHAVKGDMDQIRTRMDSVEEGVTQQMHSTLAMLTKITNNYDDQARSLADLKLGQKGMEERIAALEKQPAGSVWVRWIDLKLLAKATRRPLPEVEEAWLPRQAHLPAGEKALLFPTCLACGGHAAPHKFCKHFMGLLVQSDRGGTQTRQVLFLDVDGVLHPIQARHPRQQFVNGCLALVADVVKATGAAICLSTAWRLDPQARKFVEGKLQDFGLGPPVGRTPNLAQFHRSREILAWVHKFKPATWVALDDWPLIEEEPKMQGHFVQSRPRYGLQPDTAQKVVELFKLQQQHIKCQPLARG